MSLKLGRPCFSSSDALHVHPLAPQIHWRPAAWRCRLGSGRDGLAEVVPAAAASRHSFQAPREAGYLRAGGRVPMADASPTGTAPPLCPGRPNKGSPAGLSLAHQAGLKKGGQAASRLVQAKINTTTAALAPPFDFCPKTTNIFTILPDATRQ
jgi:hypothetical protein